MAECRWCNRLIPDNSSHCPYCGQLYEREILCGRCGRPVPVGVRICASCGHFMDSEFPEEIPLEAQAPTPLEAQAPESVVPPEMPGDSISAWPAAGRDRTPAVEKEKPRQQMYASKSDPVYYAALVCSISAVFFIIVPIFSTVLSVITLLLAGFGYYRHYLYGSEYSGFSVNIVASVLGFIMLPVSLLTKIEF